MGILVHDVYDLVLGQTAAQAHHGLAHRVDDGLCLHADGGEVHGSAVLRIGVLGVASEPALLVDGSRITGTRLQRLETDRRAHSPQKVNVLGLQHHVVQVREELYLLSGLLFGNQVRVNSGLDNRAEGRLADVVLSHFIDCVSFGVPEHGHLSVLLEGQANRLSHRVDRVFLLGGLHLCVTLRAPLVDDGLDDILKLVSTVPISVHTGIGIADNFFSDICAELVSGLLVCLSINISILAQIRREHSLSLLRCSGILISLDAALVQVRVSRSPVTEEVLMPGFMVAQLLKGEERAVRLYDGLDAKMRHTVTVAVRTGDGNPVHGSPQTNADAGELLGLSLHVLRPGVLRHLVENSTPIRSRRGANRRIVIQKSSRSFSMSSRNCFSTFGSGSVLSPRSAFALSSSCAFIKSSSIHAGTLVGLPL